MRAIPLKGMGVFGMMAALVVTLASSANAQPTTVGGDSFELVASKAGPQLFLLAVDQQGRIYAGNNSNNATGIPVQRFNPALFTGIPITLEDFGPAVGDADGMAFTGSAIRVADQDQGIIEIPIANPGGAFLRLPGVAVGPFGSPFVYRPSDGHVFAGEGFAPEIREYDASGNLISTHAVGDGVETMAIDPASGKIFYADFSSHVRMFDPATGVDSLVGTSTGVIDGGLFYDTLTGLIFVGTANASNPGLVETIDPTTHTTTLFATGFKGSTGILRDPVSGDLYFLDGGANPSSGKSDLYRLPTRFIPPARIQLTPESATSPLNTVHSLDAVVEGDHPLENVAITFEVISGPNSGVSGIVPTDAVGHATFSYTGGDTPGIDEIVATFVSSEGRTITSNTAQKVWIPMVTIATVDPFAVEAGADRGVFRVSRGGTTASPLTVAFSVGGTSTPGSDYTTLAGGVVISAGASFADIDVAPLLDAIKEADETVVASITPNAAYVVGSSGNATVTITDGPDLIVSVLTAPVAANPGQSINVKVTTKNQGTRPTALTTTQIWLSANNVLDASDALLASVAVGALAARGSNTQIVPVTIPAVTPLSKRFLIAHADGTTVQAESSDANNIRAKAITIGPDYTVSALSSVPTTIPKGSTFTITDTTKNSFGPVLINTVTRFYLSRDTAVNAGDVVLTERTVPPLNPGQTSTASTSVTMPAGTSAGTWRVIANAEAGSQVMELKENNNTRVITVTVP